MHLFVPVWGEKYLNLFLNVSLPSQLSRNNLPIIGSKGIYRIYTQTQDRPLIENAAAFQQLCQCMRVEIIEIPDVKPEESPYKILAQVTKWALLEAIKADAPFIWLCPDWIIADGAFLTLTRLSNEKRVVLVNTAIVSKESFLSDLSDPQMSPRALVSHALKHLHWISKDSIWNKNVISNWPSRLYWRVNDQGLLLRGFHLHPLLVWPQKKDVILDNTLDGGDYLLRACPDKTRWEVIKDSDDLVLFELCSDAHQKDFRTKRHSPYLYIGWWGRKYLAPHHRLMICHQYYAHSGPKQLELKQVQRESNRIVAQVIANIYLRISLYALQKTPSRIWRPIRLLIRDLRHKKRSWFPLAFWLAGLSFALLMAVACLMTTWRSKSGVTQIDVGQIQAMREAK